MYRKMVKLFRMLSKTGKQQISVEKKTPKTQEKITSFNLGRKKKKEKEGSFSFLLFFSFLFSWGKYAPLNQLKSLIFPGRYHPQNKQGDEIKLHCLLRML